MPKWIKISRTDFWGFTLFMVGLFFFVGHWIAEKNLNVDHVIAIGGFLFMLLGAFLMIPSQMRDALKEVIPNIPFFKKSDDERRGGE